MRMAQARVRERPKIARLSWLDRIRTRFRQRQNDISYQYFLFNLKWYGYRILAFLGIGLIIVLIAECLFWLWIWQLPSDRFNRLTACLDAGVVPSLRERTVYHLACLWGSL
ncbi:MAG: hypothetical protein IJV07_04765 [Alphaproteobacteria bacterium]|nr:hypothetical protein [Alphaproteobacteria bacterium]